MGGRALSCDDHGYWQLADGGWNCEAESGSTRSSFNTTICVLDALLEWERAGGATPEVAEPRLRGQEYLQARRLFRRLSTGEAIECDRMDGSDWTRLAFPTWWHYDVLRGAEYLQSAGVTPDERVGEAIHLIASKRDDDRSTSAIPARCRSSWTRQRNSPADGSPFGPCACWTGTRYAAEGKTPGSTRESSEAARAIFVLVGR